MSYLNHDPISSMAEFEQTVNPEKLAEFKEMDHTKKSDKRLHRMLVDMRIRQVDPSYRVSSDEVVDISEPE